MGILANHVPVIEQLKPGVVEVMETEKDSKKFFGFLLGNTHGKLFNLCFSQRWICYYESRLNFKHQRTRSRSYRTP